MPIFLRRGLLRRSCPTVAGGAVCLILWAGGASAQDTTTFLDPPRDPANTFQQVVPAGRADSDIRYVDETNINLITGERPAVRRNDRLSMPRFAGGDFSTIAVVLIVLALLFIFLKFGAGGMLLRADPNAPKKPRKRAKAWGLTAADQSVSDIMAQVRAMASRREALILLLRHCLLQAADETETNFRRADTEREALGRLPDTWRRYRQLQSLMFQTELVHYGGRDIDDDAYETALGHGAQILMERR